MRTWYVTCVGDGSPRMQVLHKKRPVSVVPQLEPKRTLQKAWSSTFRWGLLFVGNLHRIFNPELNGDCYEFDPFSLGKHTYDNQPEQRAALDFDDFSLENNQFLYLEQLKSMFPALKVSMFMIPWDYQLHPQMQDFQREQMIQKIKQNLDWIELIPHGLTHKPREFEAVNYKDYDVIFAAIDEVFTRYGLPYVKGFKAPYWLYNEGLVEYLNKKGWWLAVDRNQPKAPRTKKFYEYTHSIHEPFWLSKSPLIKLHGHISAPSANDLPSNMINLLKMNPKAEFKFVSELV